MAKLKWQEEYLQEVSTMDNEVLLYEFTSLTQGDDYDGMRTNQGEWKYKVVSKELFKRLQECGFIDKSAKPNFI